MILIAPGRLVSFDGEDRQSDCLIVRSLRCCYADSSTANPVNPQGTAGGGNVFNAAPIFGASTITDSGSSGADGAGTGSEATAALGGSAQGAPVAANAPASAPVVAAQSFLSTLLNSPDLLLGGAAVLILLMGFVSFHFHKKK
jgi:hypothetical protein